MSFEPKHHESKEKILNWYLQHLDMIKQFFVTGMRLDTISEDSLEKIFFGLPNQDKHLVRDVLTKEIFNAGADVLMFCKKHMPDILQTLNEQSQSLTISLIYQLRHQYSRSSASKKQIWFVQNSSKDLYKPEKSGVIPIHLLVSLYLDDIESILREIPSSAPELLYIKNIQGQTTIDLIRDQDAKRFLEKIVPNL